VGRHWAVPGRVVEELGIDEDLTVQGKLDALDDAGVIDHPAKGSNAMPTYRQYLDDSPGMSIQDIWAYQPHTRGVLYGSDEAVDEDVRWLVAQGDRERLGYQTQKPVGLLGRIIRSSCPKDGIVIDPFCGCGTTIHAAETLNRKWIGIDITSLAIGHIERRLNDAFANIKYEVHGTPNDLDGAKDLAERDKYEFQWWAVSLVDAVPYGGKKKGADTGIDGIRYFKLLDANNKPINGKIIVSVKGGASVGVGMIRDLAHVVDREKAKMGLLITLTEPTEPMNKEAVKEGFYKVSGGQYRKLQIVTVAELFVGTKPDLPPADLAAFAKAEPETKQGKLL
jgi:DNA methylase/Restriction endonuclease